MQNAKIKDLTPILEAVGETIIFAYLFGSRARQETPPYPARDVDIAVFFAASADIGTTRLALCGALSRALGRNDIDIVVLNETRNLMLLDDIIRQGIVLLDRDPDRREAFEVRILHRAIDFKTQRAALMGL